MIATLRSNRRRAIMNTMGMQSEPKKEDTRRAEGSVCGEGVASGAAIAELVKQGQGSAGLFGIKAEVPHREVLLFGRERLHVDGVHPAQGHHSAFEESRFGEHGHLDFAELAERAETRTLVDVGAALAGGTDEYRHATLVLEHESK